MSQVLHILRKDLRHLRWLLILWVAILALNVAFAAIGAATAGGTFPAAIVFREISSLLSVVQTLMLALMVARLIQDEPLVGWNAFWLTRPYSNGSLMAAKLLFVAGALVVAPLIADLAEMAVVRAGWRAQLAAAPSFLSSHLWWALGLCAVAVLTPTFARFVLTAIGVMVGGTVAMLLIVSVVIALGAVQPTTILSPMLPDPTTAVVSLVVSTLSALAVIVYQYRYRRWRIATALAVLGVMAMTFVPELWPWRFLRPSPPDPGRWSHDVASTPVVIDPRTATHTTTRDAFESSGPRLRQIHARVTLTGMPADFEVQSVTARGTLTLPDGTTLQSVRNEGIPGPGDVDMSSPTRAALGVERILNDVEERSRTWPALLAIEEDVHQRHRGKAGRLDATLDVHLRRTRVRGTLPLRAGAFLDDGLSRAEIVRASPAPGGYKLLVRQWHVMPLTGSRPDAGYEFMLRNRQESSAVELGRSMFFSGHFAGSSLASRALSAAMSGAFDVSFAGSPSGFRVQTEALEFPMRMGLGFVGLTELPASWFDNAELVVLEAAYAGTVTRSVSLADFVIPEE
jgi:hypothetical protein